MQTLNSNNVNLLEVVLDSVDFIDFLNMISEYSSETGELMAESLALRKRLPEYTKSKYKTVFSVALQTDDVNRLIRYWNNRVENGKPWLNSEDDEDNPDRLLEYFRIAYHVQDLNY